MAKYTKKWEKDFEKRYSQTMRDLQSLEQEYKEMCDTNEDKYISIYPKDSIIELGKCDSWGCYHYKKDESENKEEHINVSLNTKLGNFGFDFYSFEDVVKFRNELIEVVDKLNRPVEEVKEVVDECQEYQDLSKEEWENMEDTEHTVQVWRDCVQTWTLTVMARNSCEAEKKARMGEPEEDVRHNEDDELTDYGMETFECID